MLAVVIGVAPSAVACSTADGSARPATPELVIEQSESPDTPAGAWLTRLLAIGNGELPVPAVETMPEVFGPLVLDRQTWAEARAALETLPGAGPYRLLGFAAEPEEHRLRAIVQRGSGRATLDVVVEPTGTHRLLRAMVTPIRPPAR